MANEKLIKNLEIKGTTEFMGLELPNIFGGFGQDKKCILAKDIAEIHKVEVFNLNKLINNNILRFTENDLIDIKNCYSSEELQFTNMTNMQISKAKNIYLLSERGYTKLVAMMDNSNKKKWEVMDKLIDDYFSMKEIIQSDEQLKKELVYKLYGGGIQAIEASKQLMDIETKKVKEDTVKALKPAIDIAETFIQTKDSYDIGTFSKVLGIKELGRNKMFAYLRNIDVFKSDNLPYARYEKYFEVKYTVKRDYFGNSRNFAQSRINAQGMKYILKRLEKDGYIITKTVDQIVAELTDIENKEIA